MSATPNFKERLANITVRNSKVKHRPNTNWSMEKKIEVVSQYLILGNMRIVAATTGVGYDLIRTWKLQPWWKDLEREIRQTQNIEMDSKLSKIVDNSLDAVLDRVSNGDFFYDQKTGKIKRKPVALRDVARVSVDMISKRELLRGNATERKETTQVPIAEQLKMLAAEFAKWQKVAKPPLELVEDITDVSPKEDKYEDQGNEESEVVQDSESAIEILDSDESGGLGSSDEGEQIEESLGGFQPGNNS